MVNCQKLHLKSFIITIDPWDGRRGGGSKSIPSSIFIPLPIRTMKEKEALFNMQQSAGLTLSGISTMTSVLRLRRSHVFASTNFFVPPPGKSMLIPCAPASSGTSLTASCMAKGRNLTFLAHHIASQLATVPPAVRWPRPSSLWKPTIPQSSFPTSTS